ncbi:Coiled-coil domain-containing protein 83 [Trichoplax sp. H2]|uniref:Coiled-coil domain-containing protein 83 n=1 Tax=Trichoplax adhaerens TaxID=10228 RepID=B3S9L7_TRIAD|nr:hypothetical protein TRIADDRAFT_60952 [Trichoplax adhaerens]EDV20558.1 hypothetical protein TRIADDRAFT_60952 [Trichoplax adhaerens]RDD41859.1 Coiled-coil domain-containing protein 83 [Trichoplax sp. H2]|eukprot:XP_002116984.1 hypothetical protein TRIADDRAFT_60952 [Trichoplax adhaerens]
MGKNDKNDGKKKKTKKKRKNHKVNELIQMRETMIEIQIAGKEKLIEETQGTLRDYQEKSKILKDRNKKLKIEQLHHMKQLLKQSKERDLNLQKVEEVGYEVVEKAFQDKLATARQEERDIEEMIEEIRRRDAIIQLTQAEVDQLVDYREYGQFEHKKQIEILVQELKDIDMKFEEMADHARKAVESEKNELQRSTELQLNKQKDIATEVALQNMDKTNHVEIKDNQWMKKEIALYQEEHEKLTRLVEEIESKNLHAMGTLFDSKAADLRISKKFYLNFGEKDRTDDPQNDPYAYGLSDQDKLEVALDKLDIAKRDYTQPQEILHNSFDYQQLSTFDSGSIKVSDFLSQSDKTLGISDSKNKVQDTTEFEADFTESSEDDDDPFLDLEDEDFEDYLRLGPMELKLLSVIGVRKPIHKVTIDREDESRPEDDLSLNASWPVNHKMLKGVVKSNSRIS